jgi:hypothetical protein
MVENSTRGSDCGWCGRAYALDRSDAAARRPYNILVMSSEVETSLIIGLACNAGQDQEIPRLRSE